MTTHSPTPILALAVSELRFVQSENGITNVRQVASAAKDALQSIIRTRGRGHVLLARKILVCEGKTEEALCRVLDDFWAARNAGRSLAFLGAVPVDGGGRTSGPGSASEFGRLGYEVLYFGDSDAPIQPSAEQLLAQGISVVQWADNLSTEQRIVLDLPWPNLQDFVDTAISLRGDQPVLCAIGETLHSNLVEKGSAINGWVGAGIDEHAIRLAVGLAAKNTLGGWFKDLNSGEKLGRVVIAALPLIPASDLATKLTQIEHWLYAG